MKHSLKRVHVPPHKAVARIDRRVRPNSAYRCTCGQKLHGTSRRDARLGLQLHRAEVQA